MEADETKKLEEQRTRGLSAQFFLQSLEEGDQYFKKLFAEIDDELTKAINGLHPTATAAFTVLQAQRQVLYEPINRVHRDVDMGKRADDILSGKNDAGGIL